MNDSPEKKNTESKSKKGESAEFNAGLDQLILEELKTNNSGLCINELNSKLCRKLGEADMRTRIKSHLRYLIAFGNTTGLFEISSKTIDEIGRKGKKKVFVYHSKIFNADIQLMLRSFRAIKGKPIENDKGDSIDEKTGKHIYPINSRRFFANYTTKKFIASFDNEDPPELRNPKMPENIRTILYAITNRKALAVRYGDYNFNKQLCVRKNKNGTDKVYTIYPINMVVSLGRYYLYCRHEGFKNLSCLRVDRIISCADLKNKDFDLDKEKRLIMNRVREPHFAQRLYMFTGESQKITFLTDEKHLNDVFDWFGSDIELSKMSDNTIQVRVKADQNAMLYWALQYCRYVKVTSPPELVERIKKTLEEASEKYK